MRLYDVEIWGPFASPAGAPAAFDHPCDSTALAWVPSRSVANDLCYGLATEKCREWSTYQTVANLPKELGVVITAAESFRTFEDSLVEDLVREPLLDSSAQLSVDPNDDERRLFLAAWVVEQPERRSGSLYVYAGSDEAANLLAVEAGEVQGLFRPEEEAIQVVISEITSALILMNPQTLRFPLGQPSG